MYQSKQELLGDSFIAIDIRKGDFSFNYPSLKTPNGVQLIVSPNILADMKYLPFKDQSFDAITFDPPHLDLGCFTGFIAKTYGSWSVQERLGTLNTVNTEFYRVLKNGGQLIIKCLPEQVKDFEALLTNFCFYLPIPTMRANGNSKPKRGRVAATWLIGTKK